MIDVCRLCKEPNHIPLRCDEIEKGVELEMRKFIEEHVTEAMIRKCPRCTQVCQLFSSHSIHHHFHFF